MKKLVKKRQCFDIICEFYNLDSTILSSRLLAGLSLKESIKLGKMRTHSDHCFDHGGNEFQSGEALCEHYNIDYESLLNLLCSSLSLSEALKELTNKID